ncbi:energy transducer TonB [Stutzerimonas stutzeri]|uniref:Protein TonB n=1 Tax=Stutzerimonas stutzeri TaxID=316 RepID=A0A2N8SPM8_STUST|nr:energy transducer TonB [Stutzerimonas stutzeri]
MSSLSMPLPNSFPMARPQWRSHASAVTVTVALHAAVFGLLLHGWTPELTAPSPTQVLKTQLVSLPAPQPVVEAPAEPEPVPEPVEAAVEPVLEEPQVDPRIEQHRLEQAELAFKRAEEKKREEAERLEQQRLREQQRERQREQRSERERQERLEAERREQLAREARQREQAAQAEAAAAERARQAEAAAAASRQYLPIAKDAPDYPQRALDKGIEGACTVSYSVNPQGRIENPKALDDCHPLFIRPSLTAAKSFRYQPRIVDGRAVTVPEVKNTFHYRIQ